VTRVDKTRMVAAVEALCDYPGPGAGAALDQIDAVIDDFLSAARGPFLEWLDENVREDMREAMRKVFGE
jgi:hypothetical protein